MSWLENPRESVVVDRPRSITRWLSQTKRHVNPRRRFNPRTSPLLLNSICSASNVHDSLVGVERITVRLSIHSSVPVRLERASGSGICIDPKCYVVVTGRPHSDGCGKGEFTSAGGKTSLHRFLQVGHGCHLNAALCESRSVSSILGLLLSDYHPASAK